VALQTDQILRVNWARVVLLTRFVRAVAAMAPALRFSILPLIDCIATELETEPFDLFSVPECGTSHYDFVAGVSRLPEDWRSQLVNVHRFVDSHYFKRCVQPNPPAAGSASATLTSSPRAGTASLSYGIKRKHS
jgi:hypothetical protein